MNDGHRHSLPRPPGSVHSVNGSEMEQLAVNILRFNSREEMQAYLIQAAADAHTALHAHQRSITFGDCWVRFVDLANKVVEFGRVALPQEVADQMIDAGGTASDAAEAVDAAERSLAAGYLTGFAFSLYNREGEWGHTHKAHVWPIEESLFHQAAEAKWQIDLLPMSGKVNLNHAFLAMKGHVRGGH